MRKSRPGFLPGVPLALWLAFSPVSGSQTVSEFHVPTAQLSALLQEVLETHPALREAWARYRAAQQRAPQVATLPDPMLSFTQAIRSAETRVGPQQNSLTLSQRFPWFGKLDLQAQTALREAESRYYGFRALQRKLVADGKEAYYELAYLDQVLRILREEETLLDHFERLAQSRYSTGQGLQQSVIKIQAELGQLSNRILLFEQQRETIVSRLNTLRSRPPETSFDPVQQLADPPSPPLDLAALYRLAEANRPELEAVLSTIDRGQQRIQLARRDYWPDVTLGVGFINVGDREDPMGRLLPPPDNGKNVLTFSVGVNLPIWRDKLDSAVLEATENLLADKENYRKIRDEIEMAVRDEVIRLQTVEQQRELFRQVLIPQNEEALRSAEAAYRTGLVGVLDLLDSERTLLQLRLLEIRLTVDQWKALARLEQALGVPFPRPPTG